MQKSSALVGRSRRRLPGGVGCHAIKTLLIRAGLGIPLRLRLQLGHRDKCLLERWTGRRECKAITSVRLR